MTSSPLPPSPLLLFRTLSFATSIGIITLSAITPVHPSNPPPLPHPQHTSCSPSGSKHPLDIVPAILGITTTLISLLAWFVQGLDFTKCYLFFTLLDFQMALGVLVSMLRFSTSPAGAAAAGAGGGGRGLDAVTLHNKKIRKDNASIPSTLSTPSTAEETPTTLPYVTNVNPPQISPKSHTRTTPSVSYCIIV
ncbi:hypothetical protein L873DRAFT_1842670 [Choiromyces venosus 120613-1]|uniref:Uncharacterized protein n=1 Tax=Choiromyces venosus 120613-1 TaxID=1336337 RepID=A0A3N4JRT3_9PEZI|nr:hypothetical protein L873DRAFT_1842670 [Choiromyces venosus 120613-1]